MEKFQENSDHDGSQAEYRGPDTTSPGDDESAALDAGHVTPEDLKLGDVDSTALTGRPAIPEQRTAGMPKIAKVERIGEGADDRGEVAEEPVAARPTDLRIEPTISDEQHSFWMALARTSEQAGHAVVVQEANPNSDAALDHEYEQHALFSTVQEYNDTAAHSLFAAGQAALAQRGFASPSTETGERSGPLSGDLEVRSEDGSVTVHGRALDDEMAAKHLEAEPRASLELAQPWHTDSPVLFSVHTRQDVARQISDSAGTNEPVTFNVTNEFLVLPENPGIAHWMQMTMDAERGGELDSSSYEAITGEATRPLIDHGIPNEEIVTGSSNGVDTFFLPVDAIGMNSAVTQLTATELYPDNEASQSQTEIEQRLYTALDRAGFSEPETADAPVEQQPDFDEDLVAERADVASGLADALAMRDFNPTDSKTVEAISSSIANCALVAARAGDWETVDKCREHLDEIAQKTLTELSALTRVLFYQQELAFDNDATENLQARLALEKRSEGEEQPTLDTVIEECERIGISPLPWINEYAHDDEDTFRRTAEYYNQEYEDTASSEAEEQLSRIAGSLVESDVPSAELVCDVAPATIASLRNPALEARLMDKYLDKANGITVTAQSIEELVNTGRVSVANLRANLDLLQAAREHGDVDSELRLHTELPALQARITRFDNVIAKSVIRLGDSGNLHYDTALRQIYWGQEIRALGFETSGLAVSQTIDSVIKNVTERANPDVRDTLLNRLAAVSAESGRYGDVRKFITAMAPNHQPGAYVKYWNAAQTLEDIEALNPAKPRPVGDEMQAFEDEFEEQKSGLDSHYEIGKILVDDPSEFTVYDIDNEPSEGNVHPFEEHTAQLAEHAGEVALAIAHLAPRPGQPSQKKELSHAVLYRIQLDQLMDRLEDHDPEIAHSRARDLIEAPEIRDAGDKEMTFKLARVLVRSGDPEDYATAREFIRGIRGGIKDEQRQKYLLQLAQEYTEAIAA